MGARVAQADNLQTPLLFPLPMAAFRIQVTCALNSRYLITLGLLLAGWSHAEELAIETKPFEGVHTLDAKVVPQGAVPLIKIDANNNRVVVAKDAGTVDYEKGEVILNTVNITETSSPNDVIEIEAYPESNDVVGLKDLYLSFNVSNSTINMVKDVIASGEDISGVTFTRDYYTSSYPNGTLKRK